MTEFGIYELGRDVYHSDPCDQPSLSASIARIVVSQSPAHARAAHPRLNPLLVRREAAHFDIGIAAHALLLEGRDGVAVIDADDWRTVAARDARHEARVAGRVPLLAEQWDEVQAMVDAARGQLGNVDISPPLLTAGAPERTLLWEEAGVPCRALVDWLRDDYAAIDDYKTTSKSANPEKWSRTMFSFGGDMQAAFYLRGLRSLTGSDAEFRFVVQETYAPYALSVLSPAPDVLALANAKIDAALESWRVGIKDDVWPAYPTRLCHIELPPWEETRWLEREEQAA